jgi:hypothetical protein
MTEAEQLAVLKALNRVEAEILRVPGRDFQIWGDIWGDRVSRAQVLNAVAKVKCEFAEDLPKGKL